VELPHCGLHPVIGQLIPTAQLAAVFESFFRRPFFAVTI
jgi:hypothetical protein